MDRYSRKWMMILTDSVTGVTTANIFLLVFIDRLEFRHLYVTTIINGIFYTFQWPAYSTITSLIVPKALYDRVSGLQSLAQSLAEITSPVLAGALLGVVSLGAYRVSSIRYVEDTLPDHELIAIPVKT